MTTRGGITASRTAPRARGLRRAPRSPTGLATHRAATSLRSVPRRADTRRPRGRRCEHLQSTARPWVWEARRAELDRDAMPTALHGIRGDRSALPGSADLPAPCFGTATPRRYRGHEEDQLGELPLDLRRVALRRWLGSRSSLWRRPFEDDPYGLADHGTELPQVLRGISLSIGAVAVDMEEHEAVRSSELARDVLPKAHQIAAPGVLPAVGPRDRSRFGCRGLPGLRVLSGHRARLDAAEQLDHERAQGLIGLGAAVLGEQEHREPRSCRGAHHSPRVMRMSPTCSMPTSYASKKMPASSGVMFCQTICSRPSTSSSSQVMKVDWTRSTESNVT